MREFPVHTECTEGHQVPKMTDLGLTRSLLSLPRVVLRSGRE